MAKMDHKMVALCAAAIGIIYSAGYVVTETSVLAQDSPPAIASTQQTSKVSAEDTTTPKSQDISDLKVPATTAPTAKAQEVSKVTVPATTTATPQAQAVANVPAPAPAPAPAATTPQAQDVPNVTVPVANTSTVNTQIVPDTTAPIQKAPSTPVSSTPSTATTQGKYRDGTYIGQGSSQIGALVVSVTVKQGKIVSCVITKCSTRYSISSIDPVLPNEVLARQSGNIDIVSGATKSAQVFKVAIQDALNQAKV